MQMRMIFGIITVFVTGTLASLAANPAWAGEAHAVYQAPEQYVAESLSQQTETVPDSRTLWPNSDLRLQLKEVLGHKPSLRYKYWGQDGKTVWVLDEIGKDRPITAGIVISQGQIEDVRVLVFRESRGWEIKHNFFTRQFVNLFLEGNQDLSGRIDNITGATLSVKAMTRMAKAALLLHDHAQKDKIRLASAR